MDDEIAAAKEFKELLENWNGFVRVPTDKILKTLKYKVSLEKLFKPDEFKNISNLEKKRIKNINDRLSLMFVAGGVYNNCCSSSRPKFVKISCIVKIHQNLDGFK